MTRKEAYELIDNVCKSYNPCFCRTSTRKWVKMFALSHVEMFMYKYFNGLEEEDSKTYEQYKNRYLKRMVEINMEYIEYLQSLPEPKKKEHKEVEVKRKTRKKK